jgi:protein gp37
MSTNSTIEWTDATWNPARGCTKISPGCDHCYAATFAERFRGVEGHAYEQGFDFRLVPEKLAEPLRWQAPKKIFVNCMSDLFHIACIPRFRHPRRYQRPAAVVDLLVMDLPRLEC